MRTLIISTFFLLCASVLFGQGVRPVMDPVGYCWNPKQMDTLIAYLQSDHPLKDTQTPFVAGICPHDDYLYAGHVYFPLMRQIRTKEVVIFGVTHRTVRKVINDPKDRVILGSFDQWIGPYGNVGVSPLRDILRQKLDSDELLVSNQAQKLEHSIEGMVPFLQYFNRNIRITSIMVTGMSFERMQKVSTDVAKIISTYMRNNHLKPGVDVFFLISSDANHYGEDFDNTVFGTGEAGHRAATANDRHIAHDLLSGALTPDRVHQEMEATEEGQALWCGRYSVPFGLLTTMKVVDSLHTGDALSGTVLAYSDTYSHGVLPLYKQGFGVTAPFSLRHWVGHLSMGFKLVSGITDKKGN